MAQRVEGGNPFFAPPSMIYEGQGVEREWIYDLRLMIYDFRVFGFGSCRLGASCRREGRNNFSIAEF